MAPLFVLGLRLGVDVHDKLTRSRSWQPSAAPTVPWQPEPNEIQESFLCFLTVSCIFEARAQLSDIFFNQGEGPRTERVEVASLPVLLPVRYTVGSAAPGPHLSVWNRFNVKERDKKRYIAIVVILVEWV